MAFQKCSLCMETHVGKAQEPKSTVTTTPACRVFTRCSLTLFANNISFYVHSQLSRIKHQKPAESQGAREETFPTTLVPVCLAPAGISLWLSSRVLGFQTGKLQLRTSRQGAKATWWPEAIPCREAPWEAPGPVGGHTVLKSWLLGG